MKSHVQIPSAFLLSLLFLGGNASFAASRAYCPAVHSDLAEVQALEADNQRSLVINDYLNNEIRQDGIRFQNRAANRPFYSPIAVIGAGLHSSIFSVEANSTGHSDSVVAFESGDKISRVFGDLGGSFLINSRETPQFSTNIFPHSPMTMKDLTGQSFANSIHMGALATITQRASGIPVLFKHRVVSVVDTRITQEKALGRYKLTSADGTIAYADKLVLATGLGAPSSKVPDPTFQSLLNRYEKLSGSQPTRVQPVMTADSFLKVMTEIQKQKASLKVQTENKTVAVVGVGDGAKIAIEALLAQGDPSLKILWLGQKARTPDEYKASTWERYHGIAEEMGRRVQGGYMGHVTAGTESADGRIHLHYGPQNQNVIADIVLNCTGYENVVPEILQSLTGSAQSLNIDLKPVIGTTSYSPSTVIGKQVEITGLPEQQIYVIGPAAGALASESELKETRTQNPVAVEVLGPRSQALADYLTQDLQAARRPHLKGAPVSQTVTAEMTTPAAQALKLDNRGLRNLSQIEWIRFLKTFEIGSSLIVLKLNSTANPRSLQISLAGLDPDSGHLLAKKLSKESQLLSLFQSWMQAQNSGQLIYEAP